MLNATVARVYVNQVEVGSLPMDQYRRIVDDVNAEVHGDRRLYLAQAFNLVKCAYRVVTLILKLALILFLLVLISGTLVAPDEITWLVAAMRNATPAEVTHGMRVALFVYSGLSAFLVLLAATFIGHRFGYVNQFKDSSGARINLRIREILEVPADGDMGISFADGKSHHEQ